MICNNFVTTTNKIINLNYDTPITTVFRFNTELCILRLLNKLLETEFL